MYKNKNIYFDVIRDGDAQKIQNFCNDYDIQAGIEDTGIWIRPRSIKDVNEMIQGEGAYWSIKLLDNDKIIGFVSIGSNWLVKTFEPMFFIDKAYQNKGYGKETLELVLMIGFLEMNHRKCIATIFSFNKASKENFVNRNFSTEGVLREECFRKGRYWDVYKMGLMIDEWKRVESCQPMKSRKKTMLLKDIN